jgi:peptidoglycan-N-acetylmuramic acid deacetylase
MRAKNHKRPPAEASMQWISDPDCQGYYIDPAVTDEANECNKVLYLTFDAGYENGNIKKILDVLEEKEAPASFFILSHLLSQETDLVNRMFAQGHTVCNHTSHHPDMSSIKDRAKFETEIREMEKLCEQLTGKPIAKLYRPPEGRFNRQNLEWATQMGYRTIFWSFAYADWDNNRQPDPVASQKKILDNIHNGAILLLHPTSATNAAILGTVIDECRAMGYRFATLEELPEHPKETP